MNATHTDRRHFYQTIALVGSALGLFVACGMGARPSMPATPAPPLAPLAMLSLSTTKLVFQDTAVGTQSPPVRLGVINDDSVPLTFTAIEPGFSRGGAFVVDSNSCGSVLTPGTSCVVSVVYRPTTVGRTIDRLFFYILGRQSVSVPFDAVGVPAPPPPPKTP